MREILFRGKTEAGEWVYGGIGYQESDEVAIIGALDKYQSLYDFGIKSSYVIPETVGQFTGLTDKNGKRIFEGDIVTGLFLFGLSFNSVVTFKDGAFGLEWYRGDAKNFDAFTSICHVEYEVIGSIHDNPELLERKDTE